MVCCYEPVGEGGKVNLCGVTDTTLTDIQAVGFDVLSKFVTEGH